MLSVVSGRCFWAMLPSVDVVTLTLWLLPSIFLLTAFQTLL